MTVPASTAVVQPSKQAKCAQPHCSLSRASGWAHQQAGRVGEARPHPAMGLHACTARTVLAGRARPLPCQTARPGCGPWPRPCRCSSSRSRRARTWTSTRSSATWRASSTSPGALTSYSFHLRRALLVGTPSIQDAPPLHPHAGRPSWWRSSPQCQRSTRPCSCLSSRWVVVTEGSWGQLHRRTL